MKMRKVSIISYRTRNPRVSQAPMVSLIKATTGDMNIKEKVLFPEDGM